MIKGMILMDEQDLDYALFTKTKVNLLEDGIIIEQGLIDCHAEHTIEINGNKYFKQRYTVVVK